ncbi:hypothetical protein [Roseateles sp. P5_E11]
MFFFMHPRPVVDRRPVAEQSVQVKAPTLPALTALAKAPWGEAPRQVSADEPASLQRVRRGLLLPRS